MSKLRQSSSSSSRSTASLRAAAAQLPALLPDLAELDTDFAQIIVDWDYFRSSRLEKSKATDAQLSQQSAAAATCKPSACEQCSSLLKWWPEKRIEQLLLKSQWSKDDQRVARQNLAQVAAKLRQSRSLQPKPDALPPTR